MCADWRHLDAAAVMLDPGLVETEAFDIGEATRGHQQIGAVDMTGSHVSLS
jgi:hypothetical protein